MSNLNKAIILVVVILAIGVGLVVWKKKVGGQGTVSFNRITREEIELLLSDVAKTQPMLLKKLAEDPEMKKQQIENLRQLLAFASEAKKEGIADEPANKQELENIRAEILASNYDKEINKDKGQMPPFGFITEDQVKAYWGEDANPKSPSFWSRIGLGGTAETRTHQAEFDDFLNAKIELLKAQNPDMKPEDITEDDKTKAKDVFAKIRIYRAEFEDKAAAGTLASDFVQKTNLQVKLQQAQFLARLYSDKAADKFKVTDEEVDQYIAAHPEFDPSAKKAKAQEILTRAKNGEDFAALANQFSEDPGNNPPGGTPQGGLYKDVPKGRMVPSFEAAALGLEQGQIAPDVVESDFGFHIIKLERKLGPSTTKPDKDAPKDPKTGKPMGAPTGDTYDVRHILISTGYKDPDNPNPTAQPMPVKDFVRSKLETEKEKKVIDDIVKNNNVEVPEDFTVPQVSDDQIQQMRQKQMQQMQMQQGGPGGPGGPDGPGGVSVEPPTPTGKPAAKKPEPKKK